MADVFLYAGEPSPNDVRLRDPTQGGAPPNQEFPSDMREYSRAYPDFSFWAGPVMVVAAVVTGIAGQEFPTDLREYERPSARIDWGFQQGSPGVDRQGSQEFPVDIREYFRLAPDLSFQHGPVTSDRVYEEQQGDQEIPWETYKAKHSLDADLGFVHGSVRDNNRELASQEFPTDLREYLRPGVLLDYSFFQGPVRPNNREIATQEFPQDLREYVRPGLDRDWTFTLGPVRPNNRELASQEFPVDLREYAIRGYSDTTFILGPVRPNNEQGVQQFPIDIREFTRPVLSDLGFSQSLAPEDAQQGEGEQQFPWDIRPFASWRGLDPSFSLSLQGQVLSPGYIGTAGGSFTSFNSTVTFPAGALDQTYLFTISLPSDIVKPGYTTVGQCSGFSFPGTAFMSAASVTMPYTPPKIPASRAPADIVMLVRDDVTGAVTVTTPDSINSDLSQVNFSAMHFSAFQAAVPTPAVGGGGGSGPGGVGGTLGVTSEDSQVVISYNVQDGYADILDSRQVSGKKEGLGENWDDSWKDFEFKNVDFSFKPPPVEDIPTPFRRTPVDPKLQKRVQKVLEDEKVPEADRSDIWAALLDGTIGAYFAAKGQRGTTRGLGWLRVARALAKVFKKKP